MTAGDRPEDAARSGPAVRATTESGQVWADPSGDLLREILSDIERGNELFLVVDRLSDPDGQTYIQTIIEGGSFVVEHRDGSADRHFRAVTASKEEAHAVFIAWAAGDQGWRDALVWEHERLDQHT